jgi:hypothetical protein
MPQHCRAAGRIYLFRLLAAPKVALKARTKKTIIGYVDSTAIAGSSVYGVDGTLPFPSLVANTP